MQSEVRYSSERGFSEHGWLRSYHSFSFAGYQDKNHNSFGPLRVINEDRIQAQTGFGKHSHRTYEIWSYIVQGELTHKDSMGNRETLSRGDIQYTSAGSGIAHSEENDQLPAESVHSNLNKQQDYSANDPSDTHFLQIWALPPANQRSNPPVYYTRRHSDESKLNRLATIIQPSDATGATKPENGMEPLSTPIPCLADITMYATILDPGRSVAMTIQGGADVSAERLAYIHRIMLAGVTPPVMEREQESQSGLQVRVEQKRVDSGENQLYTCQELQEGDALKMWALHNETRVVLENTSNIRMEVLCFEIDPATD